MTPTDLTAALLRDVTRFNVTVGDHTDPSALLLETDVLAALTAALDPAIAEQAGEMLEGVTPGPWVCNTRGFVGPASTEDDQSFGMICDEVAECTYSDGAKEANARFIAWCREGVPALLAQNAFLLAEINALRAERDETLNAYKIRLFSAEAERDALRAENEAYRESHLHADKRFLHEKSRAEAAEAEVEKLREKIRYWEARIDDCEWATNTSLTEGIRAEMRAALTTEADNG